MQVCTIHGLNSHRCYERIIDPHLSRLKRLQVLIPLLLQDRHKPISVFNLFIVDKLVQPTQISSSQTRCRNCKFGGVVSPLFGYPFQVFGHTHPRQYKITNLRNHYSQRPQLLHGSSRIHHTSLTAPPSNTSAMRARVARPVSSGSASMAKNPWSMISRSGTGAASCTKSRTMNSAT